MVFLTVVLAMFLCVFVIAYLKLSIGSLKHSENRSTDFRYGQVLNSEEYFQSLKKDIFGFEYFSSLMKRIEARKMTVYYHISLVKVGRSEQSLYRLTRKDKLRQKLYKEINQSVCPTFLKVYSDEYLVVAFAIYKPLNSKDVTEKQKKLIERLPKELMFDGGLVAMDYAISSLYMSSKSVLADLDKMERRLSFGMKKALSTVEGLYIHQEESYCSAMKEKYLTRELYRSICYEEQSFHVVYQPIYDALSDEKPSAYEALVRWNNELNVGPADFVPILEQHEHLHYQFTFIVLKNVIGDLKARLSRNQLIPPVSVNISTNDLCAPNFVSDVLALTLTCEPLRKRLVFEITENNQLIYSDELKTVVESLTSLGFRFSLDDFGSGYANLDALNLSFVSTVKIDKRYVDGIEIDPHKKQTLFQVLELCAHFSRLVVIEGVENIRQVEIIKALKKSNVYIQGYYYSKPCEKTKAFALLGA